MKTDIEIKGQAVILNVSGKIDLYTSPVLRETMISLIKRKTGIIVVNLRDVTETDSSGVATFVEALKEMSLYGGKLRFVYVSVSVVKIFQFSKLDLIFDIYTDLDSAVGA
ncbi:MAG: STAS domain-containing protein [Nitrospirae bacterium YQR-1]